MVSGKAADQVHVLDGLAGGAFLKIVQRRPDDEELVVVGRAEIHEVPVADEVDIRILPGPTNEEFISVIAGVEVPDFVIPQRPVQFHVVAGKNTPDQGCGVGLEDQRMGGGVQELRDFGHVLVAETACRERSCCSAGGGGSWGRVPAQPRKIRSWCQRKRVP